MVEIKKVGSLIYPGALMSKESGVFEESRARIIIGDKRSGSLNKLLG